jgi:hypothetical protein
MAAMKRRSRPAILLVVLTLHVLAPFAAYASTKPVSGYNDLCSVYAKTVPAGVAPAGLPSQQSDRHLPSHCAFCPGGSAAAAVLPPAIALPLSLETGAVRAPVSLRAAVVAAPILLPLPRGPPASLASV